MDFIYFYLLFIIYLLFKNKIKLLNDHLYNENNLELCIPKLT